MGYTHFPRGGEGAQLNSQGSRYSQHWGIEDGTSASDSWSFDRNALLRTAAKYNIEARLAHNSYMSTSPQGTSDGARPTTSTTTAPIAIPTAAANKQRYGQHQSTSLRAAEQQSQARVSVSLSVSAPMGDALAFSTAATAATAASPTASASPASSPPDELHLDYHFLMWQAESQAGNAPLGTPPHRLRVSQSGGKPTLEAGPEAQVG